MAFSLSPNALAVLEKRYLLKDASGQPIETPEQLFWRVAHFIAHGDMAYGTSADEVETLAKAFYDLMTQGQFLPNSPTLMNAGKPNGQLSACFVLPVPDSLHGIFDTLKHAALIHQSGGGTGFSFSRLRPAGDFLNHTSGTTSGPLSFMDVYNAATEAIKQGGTRRGANMGILRVDHPDIEAFITAKQDLTRLTNFNLSVAITDAFMDAVKADQSFALRHPNTGDVVKTISARALMAQIVDSAWHSGEPGLVFIDRINADNVTPQLGAIESTNPCGEVPLLPYEACNLGSLNIHAFVKDGVFDWEHLRRAIHLVVRFLDNVITQNTYPLDEISAMVTGNRKIGLGVMGWADALIALGIPYDSETAIHLAETVMGFIDLESKRASVELAKVRGAFPFFEQSVYTQGDWFSQKHPKQTDWAELDQAIAAFGIRNATTISLAPTGTISIIAGCSGGIEPLYALAFERHILDGSTLLEVNSAFEHLLNRKNLMEQAILDTVLATGTLQRVSEFSDAEKRIFVTAHDILPEWHLRMQAVFQRYCDNAVSKTINFAETASREDIAQSYQLAYDLGLKGVTVYRNNSRQFQPMALNTQDGQHCPECHRPLERREGCFQCPDCQYAYCG